MTKFWGKLFGINFAMGVATGITMEFQFGTNWAYYSHYVGDIFGAPLAHRRADGVLPGVDVRRPVLLRLGPARQGPAPAGDVPGRARLEPVGAVDPDRQRAGCRTRSAPSSTPTRCGWSSRASPSCCSIRSRRPKFVHTRRRRLRRGVDVRARHLVVVPAAAARPVVRRALVRGRRRLRPRLGAVGHRARRRVRLHDRRGPEGEARRDRGRMGDRRSRRRRSPRSAFPTRRRETTHYAIKIPWLTGPDRHALGRHAGHRHQGPEATSTRRASATA